MASVSLLPLFFLQSDCQIADVVDDVVELGNHEVQLLDQFVGLRVLPELDSLYQGFLELHCQVVCRVHLHHGVAQSHHIFHVTVDQFSLCFKEGVQLPLRDIVGEP